MLGLPTKPPEGGVGFRRREEPQVILLSSSHSFDLKKPLKAAVSVPAGGENPGKL